MARDIKDKIRDRRWYERWMRLASQVRGKPPMDDQRLKEIMIIIYGIMDEANTFGSATASGYARETLTQVLEDIVEGHDEIHTH